MNDDDTPDFREIDIKQFLSTTLYRYLAEIHTKLEEQSDSAMATEILLTALSVNLGQIVGQLPHAKQKKCIQSLRKIIERQASAVSEMHALFDHGQIGHA